MNMETKLKIDFILDKGEPEDTIKILGTPVEEPDLSDLDDIIAKYAEKGTFTLVVPEKIQLPISALAKQSLKAVNGETDGLICINEKRGVNVQVDAYLRDQSVRFDRGYTKYMDTVQMTIGSLYDRGLKDNPNGIVEISAEEVYRTMNGLSSDEWISPQALGAVTKAIEQLRTMTVFIDYRNDPSWKAPEDKETYRKGGDAVPIIPLLPEYGIYFNKVGKMKIKYKVYRTPPFFEDSKQRRHIRTLPLELLKIKGLNSSAQNTAIKFYLLQQIESMRPTKKGGKHRPTTISYDTLFRDLNRDLSFSAQNPRADMGKYRNQITRMLDHWTDQGYISGYVENKKGRSFDSITIFLKE